MLKLWNLDRSPFNWKVRFVLAEKNVPYESVVPEDKANDPSFAKLNPFKLTPVLEFPDGRTLYESTIICEYLEEAYPTPSLLPKDPYERARVRLVEDTTDQYLYPALRALVNAKYTYAPPLLIPKKAEEVDPAAAEEATTKLHWHLAYLESELGSRKWFGGENVSLADAALVAPLTGSLKLQGLLPDAGRYPKLTAWMSRISERPSYSAAAPKEPLRIQQA